MFKTNITLCSTLASLALALFLASIPAATASASGPVWHVAGKKLGQETKQTKLQIKGAAVLNMKVGGAEIKVVCNNNVSEGAAIEGPNQGKGRLSYTSCKVEKPSSCTIAEPVVTTQLKTHLGINPNNKQQKYAELFEPQQGRTVFVFKFSGSGCGTILGSQSVKGNIAAGIMPVDQEVQEGLLNFPAAPITEIEIEQQKIKPALSWANELFTLTGAYGARLGTGESWGAFGQ